MTKQRFIAAASLVSVSWAFTALTARAATDGPDKEAVAESEDHLAASNMVSVQPVGERGTQIQLISTEGHTCEYFRVECSGFLCLIGHRGDKDATFVLPPGYKRLSFAKKIEKHGINSGGDVSWANDNPYDATIHIHGWADATSSVDLSVCGVLAVKE